MRPGRNGTCPDLPGYTAYETASGLAYDGTGEVTRRLYPIDEQHIRTYYEPSGSDNFDHAAVGYRHYNPAA